MKKSTSIIIALLILIAGTIATYLYYLQSDETTPEPTAIESVELPPPTTIEKAAPKTRQVVDAPETEIALPDLESSDAFTTNALAALLNNKTLMRMFNTDQLIYNIVVTVDNLPRKHVSMRVMPIKKLSGKFITMTRDNQTYIDPKNNARYAQYVAFAEAIGAQEMVNLYLQLYPLFQAEYEALGYQGQYFNDRLITVIDHLLATPDIAPPIAITQPKYYYLYADQAVEDRSIGQRMLIRIGSENANIVKTKLNAIKQALVLHMHEEVIE